MVFEIGNEALLYPSIVFITVKELSIRMPILKEKKILLIVLVLLAGMAYRD
jgi:hypothetical protein